jgi:hypothetical protein
VRTAALAQEVARRCAGDLSGGQWVGVEHELQVHSAHGRVDFRRAIADLPVGTPGLDPGDPRARRCDWGGVLTADGAEAELASAPVTARPGYAVELGLVTAAAHRGLADSLPECTLSGYSTHISVETPDRLAVGAARCFARTLSPSMMLLLDKATSPGLLVRPRRGRLELCGDHVVGEQLLAATVFATAGARWAATTRLRTNGLAQRPRTQAAVERYGIYVDRRAFGPDLYATGRATPLRRGRTAQGHLEASWGVLREDAETFASAYELDVVDRVVAGLAPLPSEGQGDELAPAEAAVADPFCDALTLRRRGAIRLRPLSITWAAAVFALTVDGDEIVWAVPGRLLRGALAAFDDGRLDDVLHRAARATDLPVLASADDAQRGGFFTGVAGDLTPGERHPVTGRIGGGGFGRREDKGRSDDQPRPRRFNVPKPLALAAAGTALVLVGAGAAVALTGGDDRPDRLTVRPPIFSPQPDPSTDFPDEQTNPVVREFPVLVTVDRLESQLSGSLGYEQGSTAQGTIQVSCTGTECEWATLTVEDWSLTAGFKDLAFDGTEYSSTQTETTDCPGQTYRETRFFQFVEPDGIQGRFSNEYIPIHCVDAATRTESFAWQAFFSFTSAPGVRAGG